MPTIVVDSRESRSGVANHLRRLGVEVIDEELECGDYVLSAGVLIERKTPADFVASILDRRIFSQLATLKATYPRPMQAQFVVEGFLAVGPTAAKKLLAHFGTVQAIVGASAEELTKAPGIGKKTAQVIRDVMEFDTRDMLKNAVVK